MKQTCPECQSSQNYTMCFFQSPAIPAFFTLISAHSEVSGESDFPAYSRLLSAYLTFLPKFGQKTAGFWDFFVIFRFFPHRRFFLGLYFSVSDFSPNPGGKNLSSSTQFVQMLSQNDFCDLEGKPLPGLVYSPSSAKKTIFFFRSYFDDKDAHCFF